MHPVTVAVVRNAFGSIVNEMNLALFRSAFSPVITEGRDIGGAIMDRQGRLVAQGDWDLAVFVGMLEFSHRAILQDYAGDIEPGDVFMMNDPFIGGTHFNDVGVVRPVFGPDGLEAFVAVCGHWPDVGGQEPGSFVADAREHFQEGLRMSPLKIVQAGRPNKAVFRIIEGNMRIPHERVADAYAQIGATSVGEMRLQELAKRYGWTDVRAVMDEVIHKSEQLLREEIRGIRDGVYHGQDFVDMESLARPFPKRIALTLTVEGDHMTFDFSESDGESLSASNSTYSATASAVFVTVKSLFPDIPMNHGCFAPIDVIAPLGTVVNARPPRAISSMAATVYEKVIGASLNALESALPPEKVVGTPYNLINLTIGGTSDNRPFVAYLFSEGGFGARATKDGPPGLVSLYGGGARITPAEVMERRYPMLFEEWALWPDSGGPGRFRGGVGSRKTFRLLEGEARLSCLGDREYYPSAGVLGGGSGAAHGLLLNEGQPNQENLTLKAVGRELRAGDRVTILAGGGGGYGDPLDRPTELVEQDVALELVTPAHARQAYGVVMATDGTVDDAATRSERAARRAER
ncbi:MAG: hydantoinase B/oxoprolinase family protein [Candidatus Limnocylindrales bacterium]